MEKDIGYLLMGQTIKGCLLGINLMGKGNMFGRIIRRYMRELGLIAKKMVKVNLHGLMGKFLKENIRMGKKMVRVNLHGLMEEFMMDHGNSVNKTEMVHLQTKMELKRKEFGKLVSLLLGEKNNKSVQKMELKSDRSAYIFLIKI